MPKLKKSSVRFEHTRETTKSPCSRSDTFSPTVPKSPLPPYSPSHQCMPLFKEALRQPSPDPSRRFPIGSPVRATSPPPTHHDPVERGALFFSTSNMFGFGHIGVTPVVDRTPSRPGCLAAAASRESKGSKRQLKDYKIQPTNQARSRVEELGMTAEDEFFLDIIEEILAIGETGCKAAQASFLSAALRAEDH
ncbi:unnamed protein product [Rhizoctonia solani]|uniref:Uncharacterized protein n=1 Tax=Rhizoctonia solani TaxID=456999 RepID=A0A8H3GKF4_9AGAM|nr:unnamed protein product [Rhizoctonia solani]